MKFYFDTKACLVDRNRYINVEQMINPFSMTPIDNFEDAEKWMRQFLSFELNAQPLFFTLSVVESEGNKLVKNKPYTFKIQESSGRLSGLYKSTISCLNNNEKIDIELMFADGEATLDYAFYNPGNYEFDLDNDFYIGENRFIAITTESNISNLDLPENSKSLIFTVNEK